MKEIVFDVSVIEDLRKWSKDNPKLVKKVFELLSDIQNDPFTGIGKPEPLKHEWKGYWSRRISDEHRLIYQVTSNTAIKILSVHGHYE